MKINSTLVITIFLLVFNPLFSQTEDKIDYLMENAPDSVVFQTYLDSIEKYVYRDSRKIDEYKSLCEEMIFQEEELSNNNRLGFIIQNIFYQYTLDNTMKVVELIETCLLYTSPSPRDATLSRMPSSA